MESLAYAHTAFFTNEPQERVAAWLAGRFGEPDARVYFVSGGSEANETALKLARQYWVAAGHDEKRLVVSRRQSYHGNTIGALSLSGNPGRSAVYAPLLHPWPKIEPCYAYRHRRDDENEAGYARRSADALEQAIDEFGAERIAAFFAEPVVGATLGAVPAVEGYFERIRELCDRHEILLIADEVMCGGGRSGTYFAFEQDRIRPDIVTVAKGLAGGHQPIGAAIVQGFIHERIVESFGAFAHGHTYIGHATACAAALAVAEVIERDDLLRRVTATGATLAAALEEAFRDHPHVGDVRGRGLLLGIELVRDRASKDPPAAALGLAERLKDQAMSRGLICYPGGGTADGRDGAHILLAPPFIFEPAHVDELIGKLTATLDAVVIE